MNPILSLFPLSHLQNGNINAFKGKTFASQANHFYLNAVKLLSARGELPHVRPQEVDWEPGPGLPMS
jgi:hypothetical protein